MSKTYIIAEIGVNHNGSIEQAKALIDVAAAAKVNAVKFQTFNTDAMVSKSAPKAAYQKDSSEDKQSQRDMLKQYELDVDQHRVLRNYAKQHGLDFLSTPFDIPSVEMLTDTLGLSRIKVASSDIDNALLLSALAERSCHLILSTGMASLGEVEQTLALLAFAYTHPRKIPDLAACKKAYSSEEGQSALKTYVSLLHCVSAYPAPLATLNLRCIQTLKNAFGLPVGLSDHSLGPMAAVAAVVLGASIIEKHITLDHNLPGPDHQASMLPDELKDMVAAIRDIEAALGTGVKTMRAEEAQTLVCSRKSIVAINDIAQNTVLNTNNITVKRPGYGVPASKYWDYIGTLADRDYRAGESIEP